LALAAFAALAVAGAPRAFADEPARTNLDVMTDLSRAAAGELYAGFAGKLAGRGVRLRPYAANEEYQFVTSIFTRVLTEKGVTVYPPAAGGAELAADSLAGEVVLEYQVMSFTLSYPKVYRAHLIGGKRVKRRADVHILGTLSSGAGGAVKWVGEASREASDQFPYGELGRVEEGTFQFTRPGVPSSGWGKYVEPVVVTGIIVGLVYLFFSNQSDS
jgi:hypothetical protein